MILLISVLVVHTNCLCIDDHRPESSISKGFRSGGHASAKACGDLEASSSRRLSAHGSKTKKRKSSIPEGFSSGRDPCSTAAPQHAPQWGSAPKKGRGGASMKDKAKKVLLDSEVGSPASG
jgi:hypothetical protein